MTRAVRRLIGDHLLTISVVVVVGTVLAVGAIFLIIAVVMAIIAPDWGLGPVD